MKSIFYAIITIASALFMSSCSYNDDSLSTPNQLGSLTFKFDNIFNNSDIIPGNSYVTQYGESLIFDRINYIISNIQLVKDDGSVYTIPKSESYFIIQEINGQIFSITLPNIPFGTYSKIKFGLGVDEAQFLLGASGQGDFLTQANALDMLWNWSSGYKFVAIEGNFASNSIASSFKIHTGKTGLAYNYVEILQTLPELALVRKDFAPSIHIMVDINKIFTDIKLSDQSEIMGGLKVSDITENASTMFTVHHVHNF